MTTTTTMTKARARVRSFPTSASRRFSTLTATAAAAAAAICLCFGFSCIGSIDAFIVPTSPSSQLPKSQSFSSSSNDGGIGSKSSSSSSLGLFSPGDNVASKSRQNNKKDQGKNKEDDDLLSLSRTSSLQSSTLKLFNNKININPFYGTLWLGFLVYGIFFSPGEALNPADTQIIEQLISNPTNSAASTGEMINPLFFMVFNGLGLVPLVMAQLVVPQSALVATSSSSKDGEGESASGGGGISSVPFVLGSFAAGFGSLGLYLTFRNPPPPSIENTSEVNDEPLLTLEETSWFTRNVLESKFFAVSVVLILSSLFVTSGLFTTSSSLSPTDVVDGYQQLASTSKLVTVSSVDLMILTVTAATLIPSDYKLRTQRTGGNSDAEIDDADLTEQQINLLAASTALLPVIGAAIYCALRPSLPSSDSSES